ncbi:hypothetical protein [Fodinicurvata halophila]|uniref:hypothetical protein n=1 Tax=Fodinicurvata halophila TaxID=1419723 RepID=UPI003626358F
MKRGTLVLLLCWAALLLGLAAAAGWVLSRPQLPVSYTTDSQAYEVVLPEESPPETARETAEDADSLEAVSEAEPEVAEPSEPESTEPEPEETEQVGELQLTRPLSCARKSSLMASGSRTPR